MSTEIPQIYALSSFFRILCDNRQDFPVHESHRGLQSTIGDKDVYLYLYSLFSNVEHYWNTNWILFNCGLGIRKTLESDPVSLFTSLVSGLEVPESQVIVKPYHTGVSIAPASCPDLQAQFCGIQARFKQLRGIASAKTD